MGGGLRGILRCSEVGAIITLGETRDFSAMVPRVELFVLGSVTSCVGIKEKRTLIFLIPKKCCDNVLFTFGRPSIYIAQLCLSRAPLYQNLS